jgi:hypothetical protein
MKLELFGLIELEKLLLIILLVMEIFHKLGILEIMTLLM